MNDSPHALILGGGLAGLSAAYHLGSGYRLVEGADRLGGLARTEVVNGFSFDWTGHWFHARDPGMRALIEGDWLRGNLETIPRKAVIFSQDTWTRFPYQINTHGLPPETIAECLTGFVEATLGEAGRALREKKPANMKELTLQKLGRGFGERFMFPYNTKLYALPPEELSAEWGGRFVPIPKLEQVVRGALGLEGDSAGYNATFWYPREGGIEALPRAIASRLTGDIVLGARVAAIDPAKKSVRLDDGRELGYGALVSTLPLTALAKLWVGAPAAVTAAAARLRSVSVTVVEVGVRGPPKRAFHWAYFPEAKFPFYRVGSPSQVHAPLAPPGTHSYAVEFSHAGPVDREAKIREAMDGLAACGLLDARDVVLARARTIPTAYVLFDHAYGEARRAVLDAAAAAGIVVAGRYGLWEYSAMEDALLSGRAAAERVKAAR